MATGDRVRTSWQVQHEIIEAAQERGWEVLRIDMRQGMTLEEPVRGGAVLNVSLGAFIDPPAFIRSLPEARQPEDRNPALPPLQSDDDLRFSRADPNRP